LQPVEHLPAAASNKAELVGSRVLATRRPTQRRKRSFRNSWIAIRESSDGVSTRHASRGVVRRRGSDRSEQQPDPEVGATGSRPVAPKDLGFASAYVFGAVCPSAGRVAALIMPICNTLAMNHHLSEISSHVAAPAFARAGFAHAVVILDGAGWHSSQGLVVPGNITLLEPPPYSPELNPVERVWHYLRSHRLPTRYFVAWRTSWMPARRPGTGLPPITPRSARSAVRWAPASPAQ
jgi:hypothetical protein